MNRIQSVDLFRIIAIFSIILIHTSPFNSTYFGDEEPYSLPGIIINQLSRFAVPFFFTISGYFWGKKVQSTLNPLGTAHQFGKRIGVILIFWSAIYSFPISNLEVYSYLIDGNIRSVYWILISHFEEILDFIINHPLTFLMRGTKVHLWFLTSLLFCSYIAAIFVNARKTKLLTILSLSLYVFALQAKAYINTPLGIDIGVIEFNTRNGPFFGLLPFVTGYLISSRQIRDTWAYWGLTLIALGLLMHFSEIYYLWKHYNVDPYQDFVAGTYFMGTGITLITLSNPNPLRIRAISNIGKYTLGIYASHIIFENLLSQILTSTHSLLWELGYPIIVFLLSLALTIALAKSRITKRFVM